MFRQSGYLQHFLTGSFGITSTFPLSHRSVLHRELPSLDQRELPLDRSLGQAPCWMVEKVEPPRSFGPPLPQSSSGQALVQGGEFLEFQLLTCVNNQSPSNPITQSRNNPITSHPTSNYQSPSNPIKNHPITQSPSNPITKPPTTNHQPPNNPIINNQSPLPLTILLLLFLIPQITRAQTEPIRVGSKSFTESVLLAEIVTQLVRSDGRDAEHRAQLGGTAILWNGLQAGEIDIYPDYTGTLIQEVLAAENIQTIAGTRSVA